MLDAQPIEVTAKGLMVSNSFDLNGKVALVTGASSGMGRGKGAA
jgi:hypothetical protein